MNNYNSKHQPHRELQSLNFSGQAAVTAVVATLSDSSDESLAMKPRTDCFDTATKGPLTKNEGDGKHLRCQTEKEKLNLETASILDGMRPCGIILFINELFISESLSQVYGILHEFLSRQENVLNNLEYICYDDGCDLRKFSQNPARKDITNTTKQLATIPIMVDKMHIAGYIETWCSENCDSRKIKNLEEEDTQICEQTFAWLSRSPT